MFLQVLFKNRIGKRNAPQTELEEKQEVYPDWVSKPSNIQGPLLLPLKKEDSRVHLPPPHAL